ncbi:MAG: DUF4058 family protein [Gemmataceae bacterium]
MPMHDWAVVVGRDPGLFHDFHTSWLTHLKDSLNGGGLPAGYFAMTEQRTGVYVPDVLTYSPAARPEPAGGGGTAVAEPRAERAARLRQEQVPHRRLVVRSGRRVVAVIEVVSPANKDRQGTVEAFAAKVADLLRGGVHVAVIDPLPPGAHDPGGVHPAVWAALDDADPADPCPTDRPLTFAGYRADPRPYAYLSYATVGQPLPPVPLFLDGGVFIELPLEATYMTCYDRLPAELKAVLEAG